MAITTLNLRGINRSDTATSGQVITATSAVEADFQDASAGSWTKIKSQSLAATSSSTTAMDFIHGTSDVVFDNTYNLYQVRVVNLLNDANEADFLVRITDDGGTSFETTGYLSTITQGIYPTTSTPRNTTAALLWAAAIKGAYAEYDKGQSGCTIWFNNPSDTAGRPNGRMIFNTVYNTASGVPIITTSSGVFTTTGDFNGFRLTYNTGNILYMKATLYGCNV